MILMQIKWDTWSPRVAKRQWNKIIKAAWESVGRRWRGRMLRKHFTQTGATEYGYVRRSYKYNLRKQREKGHRKPLVWSGESMQRALAGDVRSTRKGAKIVMNAPTLNRSPRRRRMNMRSELIRVSPTEMKVLEQVLVDRIDSQISRLKGEGRKS